ncbi:hypothetical protein Sfulv_00880 [Streptomyces fulvorobeus]|uniref:Uncharacterized protein n=1 Tax=Streptomyces fulvorobeus TaxID=284028 RepID=A0A7J0BZV0_9ACTN|nr:hypothetical protein Sfulv_00880 [Streptomyces fulvorobeus]
MLDHIVTHVVQYLIGVPVTSVQQPVHPVRAPMPSLLRERPAVLPLQRRYEPPHIRQRRLPRLRPGKPVHEPLMHLTQTRRPRPHITKYPTHNQPNDQPGHQ